MKSNASLLAMLAIAAGTLLGAASGCELIAGVDRNKIQGTGGDAGSGGTTQGGGGTTTTTSSTDGGGGTTTTPPMCVDPAKDCPAPSGECKVAICDGDGKCAEENVKDGDDATTQSTGDCKKNVCQGGAVTAANDDTDPLDDNNLCTQDVCNNGSPESTPQSAGFTCMLNGAAAVCDGAGVCVECNASADCKDPLEPFCSNKQCIPVTCDDNLLNGDETDVDCGGACNGCDTGKICSDGGDCYNKICGAGGTCDAPSCTDGVQNNGMYLMNNGETDVDCGGPCPTKCGPMKGCNGNGDCAGNECTGVGGTCVPNCADSTKNNVETDVDCGGGTCNGCAVTKECNGADANCVSTAFCNMMSKCEAKKAIGAMCMGANQCTSTFCADGVCCINACTANCQACDLPGLVGSCNLIDAGEDPDNECNGNGGADLCDGTGACAKDTGFSCSSAAECASGFCADGFCCETACAGSCEACSLAKSGAPNGTCDFVNAGDDPDNECTLSLQCNGSGGCQPKKGNGGSCTMGTECVSTFCADEVCCGNACTPNCQACSAVKKGQGTDGTCGFIIANQDPDNECAGSLDCDGVGMCEAPLAVGSPCTLGTDCASTFCADGFCCNNACGGLCEACSAAKSGGTNGTCDPVDSGMDPDNECAGATNCNGSNMCN